MNKANLIGRLTRDIELKYTTSGKAVAQATLAINRRYKSDGVQDTDFINIVLWGATAENASKYLRKGSKVGVVGRLQSRSYKARDGSNRNITEVVAEEVEFLDSKQNSNAANMNDFQPIDDDDDLPF